MNYSELEAIYKQMRHYDRHMGLELTVHEPGRITYRLQVDEQHLSSPTACHGGVIAGMMDAVSWVLRHCPGRFFGASFVLLWNSRLTFLLR